MGDFINQIQKYNNFYISEKNKKNYKTKNKIYLENLFYNDFVACFKSSDLQTSYKKFLNPIFFDEYYQKNKIDFVTKTEFLQIYRRILKQVYKDFADTQDLYTPKIDNKLLIKRLIDYTYDKYNADAFDILERCKYKILSQLEESYQLEIFFDNYNKKKNKPYLKEEAFKRKMKYAFCLGLYAGSKKAIKNLYRRKKRR